MPGDLAEYARYFQQGSRVRVGVPLVEGGAFQEWGVVCSLSRNLLELDLSRDYLPQQASLKLGRTLDVGVADRDGVRRCRAMVAGEPANHRMVLRLIDRVLVFEPREFFRLDVYLPLDYRLPRRQVPDEIKERWRQCRWSMEFAAQSPEPGESAELGALREEIRSRLEKRTAPPTAANLSGGGVRLNMVERLRPGMLVELTIHLPQPQRMLEIVGEVVQVVPVHGQDRFSTALRYRFIDEADRDRLIGYISAQQLWQLSQQAPTEPSAGRLGAKGGGRRLRIALGLAFLAAFVSCQARSIVMKRESGEKHEIERVFDEAIGKYLRQRQ